MKKITGLTLIEFLFALTLGLLILGLMITIFLGTAQNFHTQTELSILQENSYVALHLLRNEIGKAGYIGCNRLTNNFPFKKFLTYELNPQNKITATANSLTVRYFAQNFTTLTAPMRSETILTVSAKPEFAVNDIVIIADCQNAEFFQIKSITRIPLGQKLIATVPLSRRYEKNAEVGRYEVNTYYVAKTNRLTPAGKPIFALYCQDITQRKTELLAGIENMKINLDIKNNEILGVELQLTFTHLNSQQIICSYIACH